jgi:hypothetical protein
MARVGWLFPTIAVPILVIALLLAEKSAKDAWILEDIAPAFIVFGILLGLGLILDRSRLAELNAAIAVALLAIVPSVKYGFVYGEFDSIGHYSTAYEIARTASVASISMYGQGYAVTPLLHIFLAMTSLTGGIPVETAIVCTLFLVQFVIFVLIAESARRMFPQIDGRLVVFLTVMTVPVLFMITGTTFGLLAVAMLIYVFSRSRERHLKVSEISLTTILMFFLVFSHFVTALYFLTFLTAYTISLLTMRGFGALRGRTSDPIIKVAPRFLIFFVFWLAYVGPDFIMILRDIMVTLFLGSPLPSTAGEFPLTDLIQVLLFKYGRFLFSVLAGVGASSIALLRYRKTQTFAMFWWLLAGSLFIGGVVTLGHEAIPVWRFLAYASLVTPYFLCFLVSKGENIAWSLKTPRIRVIKATMLMTLVLSMVAAYPVTPLYPKSGGRPILDDNSVNSIYAVSGLQYFSGVYSSGDVITSFRIFWQLLSLHPTLVPLAWNAIFPTLEYVTSPSELKGELVVFDAGGKSGTSTIAMRTLAGNLTDTLGIIYSNGFLYIALGT